MRPPLPPLALFGAFAGLASAAELPADQLHFFEEKIRPIFAEHCYKCHSVKEGKSKGGLVLDSRAGWQKGGESGNPALTPGEPDSSPLIAAVRRTDPDAAMPPKQALDPQQIALLERWVKMGAPDPRDESTALPAKRSDASWWSFRPLTASEPPTAPKLPSAWSQNPIDHFVFARLADKGLTPNPPADRRTLIRRAYFDVTGLPPTPEEVEQFVGDADPDAYAKLVDRLLASSHYGERWARHWLDVVRFAESDGFEMNRARTDAWPYRDYVIRAFNEDKPYNRFILEQLAGDQLGEDAATGYLVAGAWDRVKSQDPVLTANQRADELHDMVSVTGSAFLGLTLGCARCHDHKFDPISQLDYYRVKGIFAGVQHGSRALRPPDADERTRKADGLNREVTAIDAKLNRFRPAARLERRLLLDDDTPPPAAGNAPGCVQIEQPANGKPIEYSSGTERGQLGDPGDATRLPNLGESYRYWKTDASDPGHDLFTWNPHLAGRFRIWLSWGAWTTHTHEARYLLDRDGDLATKEDQTELARIDQSQFADGTPAIAGQKRWSGFKATGIVDLRPESVVILRSGDKGGPTIADALFFEELVANTSSAPVQPHLRAPVSALANTESFSPVEAKFVRFTIQASSTTQPCIDELEIFTAGPGSQNVALAKAGAKATASDVLEDGKNAGAQISHLIDGQYGNSFAWFAKNSGRGWAQVELARTERINRIVWSRDRNGGKGGKKAYQDRLPTQYTIEVSVDGEHWQKIASSEDRLAPEYRERIRDIPTLSEVPTDQAAEVAQLSRQRSGLQQRIQELTAFPQGYVGKFEQPGSTLRLHRGDPMMPKEEVSPGTLEQFGPKLNLAADQPEAERRMALAKWIVAPENPLPARVLVNRIWHYHFGTGLVDTPSDFGFNGAMPSNPALLDWLAQQFLAGGWRMKKIHRLILLSATYRQSSEPQATGLQMDAGARFLWRFPPQRLEAEPLRDTILAVSGRLDLRAGGPGFDLFEPNDNYVKVYQSKTEFEPATFRRMIFQSKPRVQLDDTFGVFDTPDAGQITPKRTTSTTPLQALNLLNSPFALQQAGFFAERLAKDCGPDKPAQIRRAFLLAYGRAPEPEETADSLALIDAYGLPVFCRSLLNTSEFLTVF